jgi:hypothetical protein
VPRRRSIIQCVPRALTLPLLIPLATACSNNGVAIVDVDCTKEESKALCSKFGVQGYPTLKYFTDSTDAMGGKVHQASPSFSSPFLSSRPPSNTPLPRRLDLRVPLLLFQPLTSSPSLPPPQRISPPSRTLALDHLITPSQPQLQLQPLQPHVRSFSQSLPSQTSLVSLNFRAARPT